MNLLARPIIAGYLALFLLSDCKSQGIGERCTVGLNSDCEQGLACVAAGTAYGVCCPPDQSCASNPTETVDAATTDAAPPDAGDNDGSTGDAPSPEDGRAE
jgi:hypothetical protein